MSRSSSLPVIITCALVGAELNRQQAPYLPLTAEEISQSAIEATEAGASVVHLHVRDTAGQPSCDAGIFQEVIQKIRRHSDVVIQVSTGGAIGDSFAQRLQPLEAGPDMASLTLGSVNFGEEVFLNPLPEIRVLAQAMRSKAIVPELEIFDTAMLETAGRLCREGLLSAPLHLAWVMGVPGAIPATERHLDFLIQNIPEMATWSLAAIGRHQFPMLESALKKGGHVRVGMEDNLYLEKGVLAVSNAQLVAKAAAMARALNRPVATPQEARRILQLIL